MKQTSNAEGVSEENWMSLGETLRCNWKPISSDKTTQQQGRRKERKTEATTPQNAIIIIIMFDFIQQISFSLFVQPLPPPPSLPLTISIPLYSINPTPLLPYNIACTFVSPTRLLTTHQSPVVRIRKETKKIRAEDPPKLSSPHPFSVAFPYYTIPTSLFPH